MHLVQDYVVECSIADHPRDIRLIEAHLRQNGHVGTVGAKKAGPRTPQDVADAIDGDDLPEDHDRRDHFVQRAARATALDIEVIEIGGARAADDFGTDSRGRVEERGVHGLGDCGQCRRSVLAQIDHVIAEDGRRDGRRGRANDGAQRLRFCAPTEGPDGGRCCPSGIGCDIRRAGQKTVAATDAEHHRGCRYTVPVLIGHLEANGRRDDGATKSTLVVSAEHRDAGGGTWCADR